MEPNILLDALLDKAGMSRAGLATRVNEITRANERPSKYNHASVIRWLRGQRPRGEVPAYICDILSKRLHRPLKLEDIGMGQSGVPESAVAPLDGFIDKSAVLWRGDEQHRPDLRTASIITGLRAVGPVWEWENPPEDQDVSRRGELRVGMADVAMLRAARRHYEQMYRKAGGVATRARVVSLLTSEAAPLLRGTYTDAVGRELHRAVGGLVAIAGICSYDSDTQGLAQRYFHQALRMAKASGDRGFGGYVVGLMVNQSIYLREYRQALAFAEAAVRTAGAHISPALATEIYAMQAKAYARMGDHSGVHRCMALAETSSGQIRRDEEPAETGYVQEGLVEAQTHARGRVHRLATLTDIELRRGEADRAAATGDSMLDIAQGMQSRRLRDRMVTVRNAFSANGWERGP